jgi:hypothetical protein
VKFLGVDSESPTGYRWSGPGWECELCRSLQYGWWQATLKAGTILFRSDPGISPELVMSSLEATMREYLEAFRVALGEAPPPAKKSWWKP